MQVGGAAVRSHHVYSSLRLCNSRQHGVVSQFNHVDVPASDSPVWKRKDHDSKPVRCVGCGWRGQSDPQLDLVHQPAVITSTTSGSASTGSLAAVGNNNWFAGNNNVALRRNGGGLA